MDNFRETIHGTELIDPYRWLENHESPETRKGHTRDEYSISGDYWSGSFGQGEEFNFDWFISHEANIIVIIGRRGFRLSGDDVAFPSGSAHLSDAFLEVGAG